MNMNDSCGEQIETQQSLGNRGPQFDSDYILNDTMNAN